MHDGRTMMKRRLRDGYASSSSISRICTARRLHDDETAVTRRLRELELHLEDLHCATVARRLHGGYASSRGSIHHLTRTPTVARSGSLTSADGVVLMSEAELIRADYTYPTTSLRPSASTGFVQPGAARDTPSLDRIPSHLVGVDRVHRSF